MITLEIMNNNQKVWSQEIVRKHHYLHAPVDVRCSIEGYVIKLDNLPKDNIIGLFLFGRPEATRCGNWYGGVADVLTGKCEVTRWQVLNLARVWLSPDVQPGGIYFSPDYLPGFTDRKGNFRSILASTAVNQALETISLDYLLSRPPVFLDEPYQIDYCLSYCDTRVHKGTLYQKSGFELYRTNKTGIQTWRKRLKPLSENDHARIKQASLISPRAQKFRAAKQSEYLQSSFLID